MIKILIVENNKLKCRDIINNIVGIDLNYSIAYTGKEALTIIKKKEIDLILLDNNLPDLSGKEFIDNIINQDIEKYKKSIIIFSELNELHLTPKERQYVFDYFYSPLNYKEMTETIYHFWLQGDKKSTISKIHKELEKLHFRFSYYGTQYLIDCIYEIYIKENKSNINLSKDIYPIIAIKYNKKSNTINSNLKKSINAMYYDCDGNFLKEYFQCYDIEKPKLKELMFKIIENISI